MKTHEDMENFVSEMIAYIGDNPERSSVVDTPKRVVKSWNELFAGYKTDPDTLFTEFDGEDYDQIVLMKDIEFVSFCEHHILPFVGKAHVAYIADGSVVGASKLARVVDAYAKRLQMQERICQQVVQCIDRNINTKGTACIIEAKHYCMCARGVGKQHSYMVTSAVSGQFKEHREMEQKLFQMIQMSNGK